MTGSRAKASTSSGENSFLRKLCQPQPPTIAALSVQYLGGAIMSSTPLGRRAASTRRYSALQATPPAATSVRTLNAFAAAIALRTSTSTTAY